MNLFIKIGCRAYQFCFRLAIPVLPYRDPEIIRSAGEVPGKLQAQKIGRVLIVTDALDAVKLIFANLEKAYNDGDEASRRSMLNAAFLAGRAFSKSYVGYIHAVAHSLGGAYNIPHGLANAMLMLIVLDLYGKAAYKKFHELAAAAGIAAPGESDEAAAREANPLYPVPVLMDAAALKEDLGKSDYEGFMCETGLAPLPQGTRRC